MKNNMMVIGGNSIQELELNLEAMKKVLSMGTPAMVVGGTSAEDIEKGMQVLKTMVGAVPSPTNEVVLDSIDEDIWEEDEEIDEEEYSEVNADVVAGLICENGISIESVLNVLGSAVNKEVAHYLGSEVACGSTTLSAIIADIEEEI